MIDQETATQEVAPEVVETEAEQVTAPEAAETTEGQVEPQPAEADGETPETEDEPSPSKIRRERRKAAKAEAQRRLQDLTAENERLQAQIAEYQQYAETPPPRQEDFPDYDDYVAAKNAHVALQTMDGREKARLEREAEAKQRQLDDAQAQNLQAARDNWAAVTEEAKLRYADFDAVVTANDLPITQDMAQHMMLSEHGADIAYFLGTNKGEAEAIAQMPPDKRAGAMAMLERFVPRQVPKPRTQTQAPPPVDPVKPKSSGTKRVEDMTMAEYAAARKAGKL